MLDSELNPWILEVNLSPSLAVESPIDKDVKTNLITDMYNMVGIKKNVAKQASKRTATESKVTNNATGNHSANAQGQNKNNFQKGSVPNNRHASLKR